MQSFCNTKSDVGNMSRAAIGVCVLRLSCHSKNGAKVDTARPRSSNTAIPASLRLSRHVARPVSMAAKNLGYRSEEHTSELQSLMRSSYAVFCLQKNKTSNEKTH